MQMIRGINRQIIEVSDTDSDYFERALFFVSPDYCDAEPVSYTHLDVYKRQRVWTALRCADPGTFRFDDRDAWSSSFAGNAL